MREALTIHNLRDFPTSKTHVSVAILAQAILAQAVRSTQAPPSNTQAPLRGLRLVRATRGSYFDADGEVQGGGEADRSGEVGYPAVSELWSDAHEGGIRSLVEEQTPLLYRW